MTDTDTQQKTTLTAYAPKRLRKGEADESALAQLLTFLTTIEDDPDRNQSNRIVVPFSKLFEGLKNVSQLHYTERSAWEGDYQFGFLFRADIALMFYDLLVSLNLTDAKMLTEAFESLSGSEGETLGKLIDLVKNFSSLTSKTQLYEDEEKRLGSLLTTGNIHVAARFFLEYLERLKTAPEEEKTEGEGGKVGADTSTAGAVATAAALPTAGVPASTTTGAESDAPTTDQPTGPGASQPPAAPTDRPGIDVLDLKRQIFSPEARELTVRFSQIALIQLERAEGLPAGSLQNSPELREIFNKKARDFLITAITQGKLEEFRRSPESALIAIGREMMSVESGFNDVRTRSAVAQHLAATLYKNADAATLERIEKTLGTPENAEKFISNFGTDPQAQQNLGEIFNNDRAFTIDGEQHLVDISKQLNQYLKDIGTQQDKIFLAKQNIDNVLDALTMMEKPTELIGFLDEKNFRLLFGDEIPYNPAFVKEFLPEYWEERRSALGKVVGTQVLNRESQFAIDQLMDLLNKEKQAQLPENDPQKISAEVSDEVFKTTIAAPVTQTLVAHRQAGLTVEQTIRAVYSAEESTLKARVTRYYENLWHQRLSYEQKLQAIEILQLAEAGSQEAVNLATSVEWVPPQLTILNLNALEAGTVGALDPGGVVVHEGGAGGAGGDVGRVRSPLGGMRGLLQNVKNWDGFAGIAKKFGGKLTGKAAEKALAKTAGKAANAAVSAVGTPILGQLADWFTQTAATKEGRRNLILGGLASLIPLTSIGGWLGGILGGVLGWFGGPGTAAVGALLGSWVGFGVEQFIRNSLSGGGTAGGVGNILGGGGSASGLTSGGAGGIPPGAGTGVPFFTGGETSGAGAGLVGTGVAATGVQAVLATVGLVTAGVMVTNMVINNALLADFPVEDPLGTIVPGTQGKISDYVTIEKRVFVTGCAGSKCENPAFPLKAEYSIIIRPKGNYILTVHEAFDRLRVNHSAKAWEEKGLTPPDIPERIRNIGEFPTTNQTGTALYDGMVISPGEEVAFSYTETYDEQYNDAMVSNYFEMKFSYTDGTLGKSGEDSAATSEVVLIGDYSQGAGCWPVDGAISQLPNGGYSHQRVDAFDIAGNDRYPVFSPFDGEICVGHKDPAYGTHLILNADELDENIVFGHLSQSFITGCQEVAAGQQIGKVGTTGASTGPHLHFELEGNQTNPSALGLIMGAPGIQEGDAVSTCYDGDAP